MLELNETGEAYLEAIVTQMKELGLFVSGDDVLFLEDTALNYQIYRDYLEQSLILDIGDEQSKVHMQAMRHLKAVRDDCKQLGLAPMQRSKLKVEIEEKEDTILDKVNEMLGED